MEFTLEQKNTKSQVDKLIAQIESATNMTQFTLNKEVMAAHQKLSAIRKLCDHVWDQDGRCLICQLTHKEI